eukprot:200854_1
MTFQMSDKVSNFPIQFRINNDSPTKVEYLQQCTCKELIRIAKQKLSNDQLHQYTITILDDAGIGYTDDDHLQAAFYAIESDSEDVYDEDITHRTSRKLKHALRLNIILQPKQQTTHIASHSGYICQQTDQDVLQCPSLINIKNILTSFNMHIDKKNQNHSNLIDTINHIFNDNYTKSKLMNDFYHIKHDHNVDENNGHIICDMTCQYIKRHYIDRAKLLTEHILFNNNKNKKINIE